MIESVCGFIQNVAAKIPHFLVINSRYTFEDNTKHLLEKCIFHNSFLFDVAEETRNSFEINKSSFDDDDKMPERTGGLWEFTPQRNFE